MNLHSSPPAEPNEYGYPGVWPEIDLEHIVANGFAIGMIQADEEALEFAAYVRDVIQPHHIMEIGTLCGGMFYVMDRMAKPGLRISVDMPWELRDPKPCWPPHLFHRQVPGIVEVIGNAHEEGTLAKVKAVLGHDELDLLFIDADHSKQGAHLHWLMYSPLVRPGGYVAFHDVLDGWPCGEFYAELAAKHEHLTIGAKSCNPFGIGIIRL